MKSLLRVAPKAGPQVAKWAASSAESWVPSRHSAFHAPCLGQTTTGYRAWLQCLILWLTCPGVTPKLEAAEFHVSVLPAPPSKGTLHRSVPLGCWDSKCAQGPKLTGAAVLQPAPHTHSCRAVYLGEMEPLEGNGHIQLFLSRLPAQPLGVPEQHDLQSLHVKLPRWQSS